MARDKIVEIGYCIYEIVTDLWIGETQRARAQVAEVKEIDKTGGGEYHDSYSVSHLRKCLTHSGAGARRKHCARIQENLDRGEE